MHEHDVLCEPGRQVLVDHGVSAELDDDDRALEPLDVGQGLDEDGGPPLGGELFGAGVHLSSPQEVRMFSSM